jgi:putative endonuclease
MSKRETGAKYENQAAEYLLSIGFTIIARNITSRWAEIDLVALDGDELVFVEVRFRQDDTAEESISPSKAASVRRAASQYLRETGTSKEYRFDLIAIGPGGLRHHQSFL